ncbi:MAG: hemerythrin domain-containing protein [Pseudobdellovibrionaceae bacterium]
MKNMLVAELEKHHREFESIYKKIKQKCEDKKEEERDVEFCRKSFFELKKLVSAHAKAEEIALYSIFENTSGEGEKLKELKHFSLEGFKEHALVDQLMGELEKGDYASDIWTASFTILRELLEHHIEEEEEEFFPKVGKALGADALLDLSEIYKAEWLSLIEEDKMEQVREQAFESETRVND